MPACPALCYKDHASQNIWLVRAQKLFSCSHSLKVIQWEAKKAPQPEDPQTEKDTKECILGNSKCTKECTEHLHTPYGPEPEPLLIYTTMDSCDLHAHEGLPDGDLALSSCFFSASLRESLKMAKSSFI